MTATLQLLGRILMSAIFISSGFGKLQAIAGTQAYIASKGLPAPELAYWIAIVVELGGGLMLLAGLLTRQAAAALAVWCIATGVLFHSNFADRNMMIHFMKNVAMAGGLLYAAALGGGAFSLDAILARRRVGGRVAA